MTQTEAPVPLSTPSISAAAVPTTSGTIRACEWCRSRFIVRPGPGRKRIYCKTSCRQRAYERRRGLGVLPPPERLVLRPGGPLAHLPSPFPRYEAGGTSFYPGRKVHALRPAGIAERGERRATLCGVKRPPSGRPFGEGKPGATCRTCLAIARQKPAARQSRPSSELAAYRAQLDSVAVRLSRAHITDPSHHPQFAAQLLFELLAAA